MRRHSSAGRAAWIVCALFCFGLIGRGAFAQDEPKPEAPAVPATSEALPKLADLKIPNAEELFTKPPRDWVVLTDDSVIVVEPVAPRPDTLAHLERQYNELLRTKPGKKKEELEDLQKELDELKFLHVTLPGESESPEYRIPTKSVKQILYHEDLILRRVDLLTAEKNIEVAMELQILLERTYGNWAGVAERHNTLVMTDAQLRLEAGQAEAALVLVEEVFARNRNQAGLPQLADAAVAALVKQAWEKKNPRSVQHYLGRLRKMFPESAEVPRIIALLTEETNKRLQAAEQAAAAKDFRQAAIDAESAATFWPEAADLKARHRPHLARYPRLHIGVTRLAGEPTAYPFPPRAELRAKSLAGATLFSADRVAGGSTFYKTRFFNEWEPFDLGRQMQFTLKTNRQPWEMQGRLAANECAEMLLRRLDPESRDFDERLATCVDSVRVNSPYVFTVTFRRVPARMESLLSLIPAGLELETAEPPGTEGAPVQTSVSTDGTVIEDGAGGFVVRERAPQHLAYSRTRPERDGLQRYRTAEVVEHRYDSYDRTYQALLAGEISAVADLPDWFLREMQGDDKLSREFFLQPKAVPLTHLLQFNPETKALRNRELRRALAYAIPRDQILKETMLRDTKARHGRVTNIPFASNMDLAKGQYPRIEHDLPAAVAMALAAANQLGQGEELPVLRLAVPPEPVERDVCDQLVRAWKRVGIVVEIVPDDAAAGEWDIAYRTIQGTEPVLDLWPLITAQDRARMEDLQTLSAWLRHDLVELDRITDFARAQDFAREVLRKVLADCALIPLWEVDQFFVARRTIHDFSTVPVRLYDNVDRWTIDPWYPTQLP